MRTLVHQTIIYMITYFQVFIEDYLKKNSITVFPLMGYEVQVTIRVGSCILRTAVIDFTDFILVIIYDFIDSIMILK